MKLLRLYFLSCICCLLSACGTQPEVTDTDCGQRTNYSPLATTEVIPLAGKVLNESIVAKVVTSQNIIKDYLVVVYLSQGEKTCHLYTKQGEPVIDFCSFGKGPGETIAPNSVFPDNDTTNSSFWVYDAQVKKLIQWNIDSLLSGNQAPIAEKGLTNLSIFADRVYSVAGGMLAINGTGIIPTKHADRIFLLDNKGKIRHHYSTFSDSDDTIRMKSAYRQHTETISPTGTKMAYGIYFGAILETFDVKDSIRLRNRAYFIEPDFPHDKLGNPTSYDDITFGFGPLCSSDDRIYAAYNGTKDYKRMNLIAVFDWDGKLQKVYKTDFRLLRTSYDPKQHAIFATVQDETGEHQLVRFDLPEDSDDN